MKWTAAPSRRCPTQRRQIVYARASTFRAQSSSIDAGIAHVRDIFVPALGGIEGFVGLSLLVGRSSGRCIATSSWQSEEAMRASADAVRPLRARAAEFFVGSADVEQWEFAVLPRDPRSNAGACVRATWVKVSRDQIDRGIDFYK